MANAPTPRGGPGGPGGRGARGGFQKPKHLRKTMIRMFSYLTRRPVLLAIALFCVIAAALSSVAGTYFMRPIINSITEAAKNGQTDLPGLLTSILQLLGVYAIAAVCSYAQSALMAQLAQRGCNILRKELFDRLQELPLGYFDRHPHGELMSRFTNDADNIQMALEQSVVQLISSVISFTATVVMMIYLSPILFLVTVVTLAGLMLVFTKLGGKSRDYYKKQQAALGEMNGNIQEMVEGLKVVKAFTHEEAAKETFARLNENYREAASKASFYSTVLMPIANQISNIGYAVTAAVGGALAIAAGFDIGGLVAYLSYSKQLSQPLNQISMQMTNLLSALAGAERIFEVMDTEPEVDDGVIDLIPAEVDEKGVVAPYTGADRPRHWAWKVPEHNGGKLVQDGEHWLWHIPDGNGGEIIRPANGTIVEEDGKRLELVELKGDVRLIGVDFGYVPEKQVLYDVNVYAHPGQKIAFVGSTGAGKTTMTNLINRFYEISDGLILLDGLDIRHIKKDALRGAQGCVLQDTHLFTGTIMDNIRYGKLDATDEDCIRAAKTANAHSFIRRLPDGYQTMVTGDGANLSQGQRQLLAIARAAVADPPIMVLDEATSSIDTRTEKLISKGMDALMRDRTVFVIAHRLSTVRDANCIAVIEKGRIMEKGDHTDLLRQRGRYYQLYTGQFQLS